MNIEIMRMSDKNVYSTPELTKIGTIEQITNGGIGKVGDGTGGMKQPKVS